MFNPIGEIEWYSMINVNCWIQVMIKFQTLTFWTVHQTNVVLKYDMNLKTFIFCINLVVWKIAKSLQLKKVYIKVVIL